MADVDEAHVRRILDVSLRFGQLLLGSQAGTADVTSSIVAVASAYGLSHIQVDITGNSITVSIPRGVPGAPVTAMYLVQTRSLDYTRLQLTTDLAQHVVDTTPEPEWVQRQLDNLEHARHPYPRWVSTLGWAGMAGGFSVLIGAVPLVALIAAMTTAFIDRVGRVLNRYRVPLLFQQVVASGLATGVVIFLHSVGWLPSHTPISPVVAANIVVLLSGLATVGSFQDAITGYQLTALSRMMDILLSSAGILVGISIAVRVGGLAGVFVRVNPVTPVGALSVPVYIVAGAFGAAAAAIAGYAPVRAAFAAAIAGSTATLLFFGLQLVDADPIASSFAAAAATGLVGTLLAPRLKVTPLVIITAGIVPLVPGLTLYRGFVKLVNGSPTAPATIGMAAGLALALGAGAVLGPLLAPSVRRELVKSLGPVRNRRVRRGLALRLPQLAGIPRLRNR
ncbi:threonine/serine exporter family protein [Mycolicibacillus parakoreensis]|uniref:Threonine/serine exporter family protein n=1 Tax=Mycolicibacillus parakoreensis TaxID=1069221 RepID=A0ABY3U2M6_9MYCO|nr:threonine/serine exporter family protein [Mycolicibacillus parakoreensis]MCV7316160.1 threonine/serine exporter family protein [Mycolicibacillus parakoreensis]ULN52225.1 threonine/serine exporter family protein [Mycolicibacillus parakoreensis]HLR98602.1 threonine/serine exporter family protein [Mycolicibacillus parakoreensis]